MSRVFVNQFITLDGIVEDPDGSSGTERGGWAWRDGGEAVQGDKVRLREVMETATLLLGRSTWQLFSRIFPGQSDDFSIQMNRMPKLVVSSTLERVDEWSNSTLLQGDLVDEVARRKTAQDLLVSGSRSVVRSLLEHDLVDELRLLVFPVVLGEGERLFPAGISPIEMEVVSAERSGVATLVTYRRARGPQARIS
ncbi:MAG TPA: dihydrofolate reductase family protein [Candidatus Dormibacteraeota bacterium]|jgi:dihydrofolate reductase